MCGNLINSAQDKLGTNVLSEIGGKLAKPTVIHQDNLGAIFWTELVQVLCNVKHVEVKYHCVLDSVHKNPVVISYTPFGIQHCQPFYRGSHRRDVRETTCCD